MKVERIIFLSLLILLVSGSFGAALAMFLNTSVPARIEQMFFEADPVFEQVNLVHRDEEEETELLVEMPTTEKSFQPIYMDTPVPLRAFYMTSWVAGIRDWREEIIEVVETTSFNALVIDIKDETGQVAFEVSDPHIIKLAAQEIRIPYIGELIRSLNDRGIYTIARISVFQDPHFVKKRPDLAVKRLSDGEVWKDRKGLSFVDPGAREMWEYIVAIAREAHAVGFDEINFDYVRYPTDGDMQDIFFPISGAKSKTETLREFFAYLSGEIGLDLTLSIDFFGMTMTSEDDLGIGQVLEDSLSHFDYVMPMVYPSHYPPGFNGHADPNLFPYEIVYYSMSRGIERAKAVGVEKDKFRPWLQDFDYGGKYDREKIQKQIQAVRDSGLDSWAMWNPSNRYDKNKYID